MPYSESFVGVKIIRHKPLQCGLTLKPTVKCFFCSGLIKPNIFKDRICSALKTVNHSMNMAVCAYLKFRVDIVTLIQKLVN